MHRIVLSNLARINPDQRFVSVPATPMVLGTSPNRLSVRCITSWTQEVRDTSLGPFLPIHGHLFWKPFIRQHKTGVSRPQERCIVMSLVAVYVACMLVIQLWCGAFGAPVKISCDVVLRGLLLVREICSIIV